MIPVQMHHSNLRLADVVLLERLNAYHTATVKQIRDGKITLFRPYVQTADFSMGEQVICYIGIEEWEITPCENELFTVVERKELR